MLLDLTPDELLATTRSVRKRLDLTRPVEREVLEECLRLAQRHRPPATPRTGTSSWSPTPSGGPRSGSCAKRRPLIRGAAGVAAAADERVARISEAVRYLADHIHEVPVHVIPCVEGRTDRAPVVAQASRWGSIIPAAWSFMLAARARGLGSVWTTFGTCATSMRRPRSWGSRSRQ